MSGPNIPHPQTHQTPPTQNRELVTHRCRLRATGNVQCFFLGWEMKHLCSVLTVLLSCLTD